MAQIPIDTSEIVVTAARAEEHAAETAASVTIIDSARIERLGEPLVPALLRLVPSAAVAQSGSAGTFAEVRIRGAEAYHSLLFIDGIRANDPAAGNAPRFELLNADLTSRIEVVRGPQSALWGSEAIGGVVSVDGASKPKPTALGEIGSHETYRGAGSLGLEQGRLTVALAGGVQGSEGIDAFDTVGEGDRDGYWNVSIRGRAALDLGNGSEVGASGFAIRANNDFDGFSAVTFGHDDTLDNTKNRLAAARFWFAHKNEKWDARLAA